MKNRLLAGIFLLCCCKALAMGLTTEEDQKIKTGKYDIYFDDKYRSLIGYGSQELADAFNMSHNMPFVDGCILRKGGTRIPVYIPLITYIKKIKEEHTLKHLKVIFSWEAAIRYHYATFINPNPSLVAATESKLLQSLLNDKIIKVAPESEYYGHGQNGFPALLAKLQKQEGNNILSPDWQAVVTYHEECTKEKPFYPYTTPLQCFLDREIRMAPLKNVTPQLDKFTQVPA